MKISLSIIVSAFVLSLSGAANAAFPPTLDVSDEIAFSEIEDSEVSYLVNYPEVGTERGCILIQARGNSGSIDLPMLIGNLRAYAGARIIIGSVEYPVRAVPVQAFGTNSVAIPFAEPELAYQTGVSIRTVEIGESISELVKRAGRGGAAGKLSLKLGKCPSGRTPF